MELIVFFGAFIIFCSMIVKLLQKSKAKNSKLKLPPGPKPLPIIGNLHQLHGSLMHRLLREKSKNYGPLMYLKFGGVPTIIVSSAEVAKEIYRTHDILFAERPSCFLVTKTITYDYTDLVFAPYGNYWKQLRKIFTTKLLSPKRVQTFRSIREDEVLDLIKSISLQKGSSFNLSRKLFSLTYGITARAAFGKRSKHQEKFIKLVDEVTKLSAGFSISDLYPSVKLLQVISGMKRKVEAAKKDLDEILEIILNEHKEAFRKQKDSPREEETKEDFVDVLLNIQNSGDFEIQLTNDNIKAVIFDIFSAGSETSTITVEWAISEMIKNPGVMKRAQDEVRNVYMERGNVDESRIPELKYLQASIKETLRLHPSFPLIVRESREQCEIIGYDVPAKTRIIVNAWAIARDPMYWIEADKFNPERFLGSDIDFQGKNDFEYAPFGGGRRICPGISFAIANILLPVAQLLFHFDWKLPGDQMRQEELDMTEEPGLAIKRKNDLYLIPIPYSQSAVIYQH